MLENHSCGHYRSFATEAEAQRLADAMNVHIPSPTLGRHRKEPFLCKCGEWHVEAKRGDDWMLRVSVMEVSRG